MFAINFGMSRSWAAVFQDGEVIIVPSAQGAFSYVEFGNLEPKLCRKFTESVKAANSVYGIKRLLGRKFDDDVAWRFAKHSPANIVHLEGRAAVQVDYHGERRALLLEQVVAMVLSNLKEQVEKVVGHAMTDVVLTVPQSFGDAQRRTLKDAAAIAGLTCVRLLNDTTAAAVTYAQRCEAGERENVVVVDVGGGSTNVAVVEVTSKSVKVKASAGSCTLGAEEFDQSLVDYCEDELRANYKIDVSKLGELARKRLLRQLKALCIEARQQLYSSSATRIKLDIDGRDVSLDISREAFDALNDVHYNRITTLIRAAVQDSPFGASQVDAVYVVGGGSRIVTLEKSIATIFPGKRVVKNVHRDEAVVKGAAIFAKHLSNSEGDLLVNDILGRHLLVSGDKRQRLIAGKSSTFPVDIPVTIDNETSRLTMKVFEGTEGTMRPAGTFVIGDVAQQKLSTGPINCIFRVDESGLLSLSAAQEAASSQVPFSRARFSLVLDGSRGTIHESVCIVLRDGNVVRLIDASTRTVALPAHGHETLVPRADDEREVEFKLYKGNSLSSRRLTLIGSLSVALPALQNGLPVVHLSVTVDRNYLFTATATCIPPAQVEQLIIVSNQWNLPFTKTQQMAKELADTHAASKAKDALHLLCYELGLKIEELEKAGHSSATFNRLVQKRSLIISALGRNGLRTVDEYEEYKKELETLCSVMDINGSHSNVGAHPPASTSTSADRVPNVAAPRATSGIIGSIVSKFLL